MTFSPLLTSIPALHDNSLSFTLRRRCLAFSPESSYGILVLMALLINSRPNNCSSWVRHLADIPNWDVVANQLTHTTALCRLCEPIAFMSTFPYAYRMVESFNITQDETQISVYAGMLITAFAFAEFSTGTLWGSISDRIGRKPVLIMGLFGTALSMIFFGFARSLPAAIMARALGGLLNGNSGVLQTTVAELVTKKEHQAQAYAVMPFIWSMGSIIGPAMGGALAMPCTSHQSWCTKGSLLDTYPFLLPNICCVLILCAGMIFGIMFLEETHAQIKGRRDIGLELGRYLVRKTSSTATMRDSRKSGGPDSEDIAGFLKTDPPPGYCSTESSPLLTSTSTAALDSDLAMLQEKEKLGTTRKYSRHVVLIILGYAILA